MCYPDRGSRIQCRTGGEKHATQPTYTHQAVTSARERHVDAARVVGEAQRVGSHRGHHHHIRLAPLCAAPRVERVSNTKKRLLLIDPARCTWRVQGRAEVAKRRLWSLMAAGIGALNDTRPSRSALVQA